MRELNDLRQMSLPVILTYLYIPEKCTNKI